MLEFLLGLAVGKPSIVRLAGRALFCIAGALALLGVRFDRLDRIFSRAERLGAVPPPLENIAPGWLYWAIPETGFGWGFIVLLALTGVCLAVVGKQLERF